MSFSGKKIWIAGGSSGIGEALAIKFAADGAVLALTARREEKLTGLADSTGAVVYAGDVTDRSRMKEITADLQAKWGSLDMVVYSAGTYWPTPATEFDGEAHHRMMDVNYGGLINVLDAALPVCRQQQESRIVAVASVVGYRALPLASAYGASKAAMQYLFDAMRMELEPLGISMTTVNPGFVDTELTRKNSFKMPFIMSADRAADCIYEGLLKNRREIHFPARFSYMLKALRFLPYPLYMRLVSAKVLGK